MFPVHYTVELEQIVTVSRSILPVFTIPHGKSDSLNHKGLHYSICNMSKVHHHTAEANLEIRDVKLVVGRKVVCAGGGHHQLIPGLLASLFPRCRDQPEFSHGC